MSDEPTEPARDDAAETKLREEQIASTELYGRVFGALGLSIADPWHGLVEAAANVRAERDEARARLDEINKVLAEDAATRARFQVDTSTSYGPRFLSRIRAILARPAAAPAKSCAIGACKLGTCGGMADYQGPCGGCCRCLSGCLESDDYLGPAASAEPREGTPISERARMWLEANPTADPPKLATAAVERKPSTEMVSLVDEEDEESAR